ncbi:MAG: ABC transporter substrate-binding protein, partial [Pseudomonadota bacterium]
MADTIMDRRKLLGAGALGLGLAACGASEESGNGVAAPAVSRSRKRLNMVTTWPKGLPGLGRAAERVAERIETLSDGNITVKVYAAGELVPALSSFDAVADGTADLYHGAEYYWQP